MLLSSISSSTQVADDGIAYDTLDLGSDPINTDAEIRLHDADFNNDGVLDLFIADHGVGTHKGIRDSYFFYP